MSFSQKVTETRGNPLSKGWSFVEICEATKRYEQAQEAWRRRRLP